MGAFVNEFQTCFWSHYGFDHAPIKDAEKYEKILSSCLQLENASMVYNKIFNMHPDKIIGIGYVCCRDGDMLRRIVRKMIINGKIKINDDLLQVEEL